MTHLIKFCNNLGFFHTYSIDEKMIPAIKTKVVYKLSGCCFESRFCHLKAIRFDIRSVKLENKTAWFYNLRVACCEL